MTEEQKTLKELEIALDMATIKLKDKDNEVLEVWEKVHALEDDLHNSETENDKLLKINEMLNLEIKNLTLMRNSAEMRVKDLKLQLKQAYENDGKNSSHIHSGGKGGWGV